MNYADGNPYVGSKAELNGEFAGIGTEHVYFKVTAVNRHDLPA